jgi:hypothetical protein
MGQPLTIHVALNSILKYETDLLHNNVQEQRQLVENYTALIRDYEQLLNTAVSRQHAAAEELALRHDQLARVIENQPLGVLIQFCDHLDH